MFNDLLHPRYSSQPSENQETLRPPFWIFSKNRWPSGPTTFIWRPRSAPGEGRIWLLFYRKFINCQLKHCEICRKGQFVSVIAWFVVIFGINTTSDISKLLYVTSRAVRRVKFETILKYHEWYLCQISRTNQAITYTNWPFFHISQCFSTTHKRFVIFTCRYFKLSWNTLCSKPIKLQYFSCSSIKTLTTATIS